MGRIFTFGCSFTSYSWPTWADIILYGNNGYNLGISGGGYDSILYRIMEADRIFKFTSDDIAIVCLTTPIRWDLIMGEGDSLSWECVGQVTTSKNKKYLDTFYSIEGLLFKSFYNIILINDYLKKTNIKYLLGSVNDPFSNVENYFNNINLSNKTIDLISYVKTNVELQLLDFYSFLNKNESKKMWKISKKFKDQSDYHPRPKDHYRWVCEILLKKIDIEIQLTEEMLTPIEKEIDLYTIYGEVEKSLIKQFPKYFKKRYNNPAYLSIKKTKII